MQGSKVWLPEKSVAYIFCSIDAGGTRRRPNSVYRTEDMLEVKNIADRLASMLDLKFELGDCSSFDPSRLKFNPSEAVTEDSRLNENFTVFNFILRSETIVSNINEVDKVCKNFPKSIDQFPQEAQGLIARLFEMQSVGRKDYLSASHQAEEVEQQILKQKYESIASKAAHLGFQSEFTRLVKPIDPDIFAKCDGKSVIKEKCAELQRKLEEVLRAQGIICQAEIEFFVANDNPHSPEMSWESPVTDKLSLAFSSSDPSRIRLEAKSPDNKLIEQIFSLSDQSAGNIRQQIEEMLVT